MRLPRLTTRRLIGAIAVIAAILALSRIPAVQVFEIYYGGPLVGAIIHRALGGRGILGGMIGGILFWWGFVILRYSQHYLYPKPNTVNYLGPFFSLAWVTVLGVVVGCQAGLGVWAVAAAFHKLRNAHERIQD